MDSLGVAPRTQRKPSGSYGRDRASSMARARSALAALSGHRPSAIASVAVNGSIRPISELKDRSPLIQLRPAPPSGPSSSEVRQQHDAFKRYYKNYELLIEYSNLRRLGHCPRGMYVIPATDNINVWYGHVFINQGYYRSSVFKFRLTIPENYPSQGPTFTFISDLFHPLVDPSGILSLRPRFPIWRPKRDLLHHVLIYAKDIFRQSTLNLLRQRECPNHDALHMYQHEPHVFEKLAQQSATLSMKDSILYDNYPEENPIKLGRIQDEQYEDLKNTLLSTAEAVHRGASTGTGYEDALDILKSLTIKMDEIFVDRQ